MSMSDIALPSSTTTTLPSPPLSAGFPLDVDCPLPKWPFGKDASGIPRGLYELHPAWDNRATYNIVLYAAAVHFMNWDASSNSDKEIAKITTVFRDTLSQLFPEARIVFLWCITSSFTTPDLLRPLACTPSIYIITEADEQTQRWFTHLRTRGLRKAFYQIKGLIFLFAHNTEPWKPVLKIIKDYDQEPRRAIDYIVFRWTKTSLPTKPGKLKVYSLPHPPSPTPSRTSSFRGAFKRSRGDKSGHGGGETDEIPVATIPLAGYEWLDRLPREVDEVSPELGTLSPDYWMVRSARQFVVSLRKVVEAVCSRGRSVWFMVRPLERMLLSGLDASIQLSHWGILVSELTRSQFDDRMREIPLDPSGVLGDLHELRNIHGRAEYRCTTYTVKLHQGVTKLDYLGQTEMNDEGLHTFGNELILKDPQYKLLKNNCQVWVQGFLEKVCPEADIERTIGQVLTTMPTFS